MYYLSINIDIIELKISQPHSFSLKKSYFTDASLLLVAVIWALNFSIVKTTLSEIDPLSFNAMRYILASGLLVFAAKQRGFNIRVKKEHFWPLIGLALIGNLLYQMFFIIGINFTHSANAAVMLGTIPVWVALLSQLFTDEKLNTYKSIGVLLAFIGVVLIITGGPNSLSLESETFLGNIITLASAFSWAVYTILSRKYLKEYNTSQFTAFMSVVGAIALILVGIPSLLKLDWQAISIAGFGGILYSGLLSVGLAYLIWNRSVSKIGAVKTAAYQNLVPVLGLLFGVFILGEQLTVQQLSGSAIVIAGIFFSRF